MGTGAGAGRPEEVVAPGKVRRARLGLIGGSGLYELAGLDRAGASGVIDTPWGAPSAEPRTGTLDGVPVAFIPRHGVAHDIPPHRVNYRANLWALQSLGVTHVVAFNAVGSIAPWFGPGSVALPVQLVDYTWGRAHTYWDRAGEPARHVEFTEPVDPGLHALLAAAAANLPAPPAGFGVYGVTQGPRLETAAEIDRLERDGCDMVGMTLMPEAALARELALAYACIAYSVNRAAGRATDSLHAQMEANVAAGTRAALALLRAALPALAGVLGPDRTS